MLSVSDKEMIYTRISTLTDLTLENLNKDMRLAFENMTIFYQVLQDTITIKYEKLSEEYKKLLYKKIYSLAGKPRTEDKPQQWGMQRAF